MSSVARASRSRWGETTRRDGDEVAAQVEDPRQVLVGGLFQDLGLQLLDLDADPLQGGEEAVGEGVEDAVDDELLAARGLAGEASPQLVQLRAGAMVERDDVAAAEEGVDLDQHLAALGAGAVVDEEHVVVVVVELGPLTEVLGVLKSQRMKVEQVAEEPDRLGARSFQVEPEELVALQ